MDHRRILVQLDSDSHASVFDAVVAIDSQIDHLLQYAGVTRANVLPLVHGAIFTRGPNQLQHTAVFVGGSDVAEGEAIGAEIQRAFIGPMRVSIMLDGNGSNTTAAAAVLCAARHADLRALDALVLGGTGPVGQRVARLLLRQGATVRLASRDVERAAAAGEKMTASMGQFAGKLHAVGSDDRGELHALLPQVSAIFGCGAAGVKLLSADQLALAKNLEVAIDLNAVPPEGLEGIAVTDKATLRHGHADYGAIGVGGLKMKIHRESIQSLFTRNDLVLDAEEIFAIGQRLEAARIV